MSTLSAPFKIKLLSAFAFVTVTFMASLAASANTVAHYRFEEGPSGATAGGAVDFSGNGHDMEGVIGSPVYTASPPVSPLPLTGDSNDLAIDFSNGNHAFQGTDGEGLSQVEFNDFTLESWVNLNSTAGWQTFVGRDDRGRQYDTNDSLFYFQKSGNAVEGQPANTFRVALITSEGELLVANSGFVLAPDTWYHLAAVGDTEAGTLSLYVDGILQKRAEGFTGLFKPSPATRWTIGRGQWGADDSIDASEGEWDWVDGRIDEIRFSDAALSPTEFLNFDASVFRFVNHPEDAAAPVGNDITFNALAAGGGEDPVTYQWEVSEDGGESWNTIPGATSSAYTVESITLAHDGNQYRAVASRDETWVSSNAAILSIVRYPDPLIVQDLAQGALAIAGEDFAYSVEVAGVGNITYQWRKDGVALVGETSDTLDLGAVNFASAGTYSVVITDDAAEEEGLDATSVTLSSVLTVAPPLKNAISFNFVGAGEGDPFSSELGIIGTDEEAGAVSVANWNNSAAVSGVAHQPEPLPLVDDTGASTSATVTWEAANTQASRVAGGAVEEKDADQRIFHGYIERRAGPSSPERAPATVTFSGIPYESYDVYVYLMAVEGTPGTFFRSVSLEDANGTRSLFLKNFAGNPAPDEIPFILSHATTLEEAQEGPMATYLRFEGTSGSALVVQHFDEIGWNSGGVAGISIVDTTPVANEAPLIVSQPEGAAVYFGESATLSVTAHGSAPLSYQWHHEGRPVEGATAPQYTVEAATKADAGRYVVVVRNEAGSALSAPVNLTVHSAPALPYDSWISGFDLPAEERAEEANPTGDGFSNLVKYALGLDPEEPASFSLQRHLGVRFPYAREIENIELAPEISDDLVSWESVPLTEYPYKEIVRHDEDSYRVLLWLKEGFEAVPQQFIRVGVNRPETNSPAGLAVPAQEGTLSPEITLQPRDTGTHLGETVTLSVTAVGEDPMNYQWYRNSMAIGGATDRALTLENVDGNEAGRYTVLVTNDHGSAVSSPAHLTVHPVEALAYATWIGGFGLPVEQQDPEAKPAGDGAPNLFKYVIGGDPTQPAASAMEDRLVLSFEHAPDIVDVRFVLDVSADGSNWESIPLDSHPHKLAVELENGNYRVYVWFDESFEETARKITRLRATR